MGGLTVRGPTVRFACRGPHDLPEPATLLSPQPSLALSQALASPEPDAALSLKRFSLAEPTCFGPSPPCLCPSPASERLLPRARPLCAVSSALLALIRAPRVRPGRPKTGVRLRRTWRVTGNMGLTYEV